MAANEVQFEVFETTDEGYFKPIFMLGRCAPPKVGMDTKTPYSKLEEPGSLEQRSRQMPLGLSVIQSESREETEYSRPPGASVGLGASIQN